MMSCCGRDSMNWRRRVVSAIGLVILWSLMACRGPALRTGHLADNPAAVIAAVGDPATNVMIVPASAAGTLGAGVTGRNLSPFPDYDQRVAQSVYNRWLVLLHDEPA